MTGYLGVSICVRIDTVSLKGTLANWCNAESVGLGSICGFINNNAHGANRGQSPLKDIYKAIQRHSHKSHKLSGQTANGSENIQVNKAQ